MEYPSPLLIRQQRREGMDVDDGATGDTGPESEEQDELFEARQQHVCYTNQLILFLFSVTHTPDQRFRRWKARLWSSFTQSTCECSEHEIHSLLSCPAWYS
jgi:hypothetical protein